MKSTTHGDTIISQALVSCKYLIHFYRIHFRSLHNGVPLWLHRLPDYSDNFLPTSSAADRRHGGVRQGSRGWHEMRWRTEFLHATRMLRSCPVCTVSQSIRQLGSSKIPITNWQRVESRPLPTVFPELQLRILIPLPIWLPTFLA